MARKSLLLFCFLLTGCMTSMGHDDPAALARTSFGSRQTVNMCVYLDDGVTATDAQNLLQSWNDEAEKYNLFVNPVSYQHRKRSGFFYWEIMRDVESIPLKAPCDRVIYFANRSVGDFMYGLATIAIGVPEVLGYVDDQTLTHGFVYANVATPAQLLISPHNTTRHELYHLLGCGEHYNMPKCYEQISQLKTAATGSDFFPTFENRQPLLLTTREQVNAKLGSAIPTTGVAQVAP
jgi:hypothetical protein